MFSKLSSPIKLFLNAFIFALVFIILNSCGGGKEFVYLKSINDTAKIDSVFTSPLKIHSGDLLSITLSSLNPEADAIINQSNSGGGNTVGGAGVNVSGYFVSDEGTINLPRLGSIVAEGKTLNQLKDTLQTMFEPYTKNPIVNVRLLNFTITVLGEVNHPGQIKISTPQVDILEVIGMVGDITAYGKKTNVLLIRKQGSNRIVRHLDLTNPKIFESPYFHLQPGDFIYVEPTQTKKNSTSLGFQIWPLATGALTLVIVILNSFRK